jgi:serine protease Do
MMYILLAFVLFSCIETKTYDDLYLEYTEFVESNLSNYQNHMDYVNKLSLETIQSVVLVKKNINIGGTSSSGSGVIVYQDQSFYYVLTNHHVVHFEKTHPLSRVSYEVVDFQGQSFQATFVNSNPSYDLGLLKIIKTSKVLMVASTTTTTNPAINEHVSILGYPGFQKNAVTLGKISGYSKVEIENQSSNVSIDFDVIVSNAPVKSGSSGSPLFDINHHLIGIVYAGNFSSSNDFSINTFAIPIEKVREYLASINIFLGGNPS